MDVTVGSLREMVSRISHIAAEADVEVSEASRAGAWHFYHAGIEDRVQIEGENLVLSNRERNLPLQDEFITSELADMEKYLIYHFCSIARPWKGFSRLLVVPIPLTNDKVAVGYEIKGGPSMFELVSPFSNIRRYASNTELIKFSHYVNLSPEELYEACMAPNGKPPFFTQPPSNR
ncbi:Imm61 family immunity protein [Paenarthrobacter sp. NPDC056912]|uniref:Imm61 family immunity protein n=1 Tax=Paenarthrobacter sp. NPDC056912 TaxID=3345965 RepID=UPI00366CD4FA